MKDDIEKLGLPTRGLNSRLQRSRPAFLPLDHSAARPHLAYIQFSRSILQCHCFAKQKNHVYMRTKCSLSWKTWLSYLEVLDILIWRKSARLHFDEALVDKVLSHVWQMRWSGDNIMPGIFIFKDMHAEKGGLKQIWQAYHCSRWG